ncbi:hypothetical protein L7F22_065130 [Adiantum nelumboides]|nr:hypothetical protein [Adiantum nelumboides]
MSCQQSKEQKRKKGMKSDTSDEPKKGKKKVKEDEAESSKKKKSRRPRRVIGIDDFPLGKNLEPYEMVEDLKSQRPNITWPQLMHLSSSIRCQWPKLASTRIPKKRKEKVVKYIKSNTPKDIEPIVDAYIKGKRVSNVYVDGGAQMCVITERTMHRLRLSITEPSDCHAKLANNSKVKCLGIIKDVHITVLDVSAKVDFYVMPSKGEGYPLSLGRSWLMEVNADQKWGSGKLVLQKGKRIVYDMKLGKQSNICFEISTDEDSSDESSYGDEESYTSEESSMEVMGLVVKRSQAKGLSTSKEVEVVAKEEPMMEERFRNMLAKDLTKEKEEDYINMFKRYPHLFITDYSMIKGVDMIQHHIDLKPDAKPVAQKLRRLGVVQQEALLSEVNKLLKAGFIYPVTNSEWVSPIAVTPKKNDAYTLLFDVAYRKQRNKAASGFVILNEEKKEVLKKGIQLHLAHSNNEAEYSTLKAGLEECKSMGIRRLMVNGDALLIVVQGTWACKNSKLLQWLHEVKLLMKDFEAIQIQHISCQHNKEADNMANTQFELMVGAIKFKEPLFQGQETMEDILYFLEISECPKHLERVQWHRLVRKALSYQFIGEYLYHKGKDLVLRRVPLVKEIEKSLMSCHDGVCGGHFAQEITSRKILQAGFVWPSLHRDVQHWCKACKACQQAGDRKLSYGPRFPIFAYGSFEKWGIDAIGPLPRTSTGNVSKFVLDYICSRFGTPLEILSDRGPGFRTNLLDACLKNLSIKHVHSTPYYPQCNGLVEKTNGVLCKIITKHVRDRPQDWDKHLTAALWAYRISFKVSTQFTPYHLVYGQEALWPIEVELGSLRILARETTSSKEKFEQRILDLQRLELDREAASDYYITQANKKRQRSLDVLIIMQELVLTGCFLRVRAIGLMPMIDQGNKDDKITIVCKDDLEFRQCSDIKDLPPHKLTKIRRCFEDYKKNQIGCNLKHIDEEDIMQESCDLFAPGFFFGTLKHFLKHF